MSVKSLRVLVLGIDDRGVGHGLLARASGSALRRARASACRCPALAGRRGGSAGPCKNRMPDSRAGACGRLRSEMTHRFRPCLFAGTG